MASTITDLVYEDEITAILLAMLPENSEVQRFVEPAGELNGVPWESVTLTFSAKGKKWSYVLMSNPVGHRHNVFRCHFNDALKLWR